MARKHRLHYPGAYYHVILRGNRQQDIFFTEKDRYRFYHLLQEGVERYGHSIHAFCLMTNHVHLLCQVEKVPLSRIVQNLAFRYARWINWCQTRNGHLFQGRYKAILIDADEYLLQLVAYIHLNPVRAQLVTDPWRYPWSSHRAYMGEEEVPWLMTRPLLNHFGSNIKSAREAFDRMVRQQSQEGHREEFHSGCKYDGRCLGDDDFYLDVQLLTDEPLRKVGVALILEAVETIYGLGRGELSSGGVSRTISEARGLAAWAVRELSDATLSELGRLVGRDVTSLSSAATRLCKRSKTDSSVKDKQERLRQLLDQTA